MAENGSRIQRETLLVAFLLFLGSLAVLYPFMDAIIMAVATAYLLRFGHDWINKYLKNDLLSSVIIISLVLAMVSLSLYFFIDNFFSILSQVNQFTGSLRQSVIGLIDLLNLPETFQQNVDNFLNSVSETAQSVLLNIFSSVPMVLIHIGIYLVTAVYLYRDRSKIRNQVEGILNDLPEPEETIIRSLLRSIDNIFRGVFMTQVIVAVILGLLTAIGFYLVGQLTTPVPFIPLWSLLVGIAALLPLVAAFMFYGPLGGYYLIAGEPVKGILILVVGVVLINILSEIFLRPYVGSRQMDEHPLVVFIGFLAGPLVLGVKGLIIGPLLLILTKEFAINYTNLVADEPARPHSDDKES